MSYYLVDQAGTIIHVDCRNTNDTPCVAIMLGAYDGFNFGFPTLGVELIAHSGTIIIGPLSDLLHAVGCGTGFRLTTVFCHHEDLVTGMNKNKSGMTTHILTGTQRSKIDTDREKRTKNKVQTEMTAEIKCLSEYEFV